MPKYMRRQPDTAPATSRASVRSPTTTSTPFARSASVRSSSRRTNARTGRPRRRSISTIALPTPPTRPGTPVTRIGLSEESIVGAPSVCLTRAPGRRGARSAKSAGLATHLRHVPRLISTRQALFRCAALSELRSVWPKWPLLRME